MATFYVEIGIAVFVFFYYLLRKRDISLPAFGHCKQIFLRSCLGFLGAILLNVSVENIGVVLTSGVNASSPMLQILLSYLILKEKLNLPKYIAIILMVAGLVIVAIG
ncbi:EamA family transporter [Candidatus Micrarchaeota archaeon]|nr:EamA family transporter [Candidatus Micrarchaeota archaeon]